MVNIKNIVIGIAVIILTFSVVVYGISTVYERPQYDDYCRDVFQINNEADCVNSGGVWYEGTGSEELKPVGRCENKQECYDEYDSALEKYSRNLFLIALPLGIVLMVVGALVFGLEAVGAGLMGGGVGVILYGVGNYWRYSADLMKFLLSLVGLIAVIGLGYWLNKKK